MPEAESRADELNFVIERARPEDIDAVMRINLQTLPENYPRYFFEYLLERFPDSFLVARVGDKVVGYIMCRVEESYSLGIPIRKVRRGHVVSIAVLPEYRKRGIGTSLLKEAIKALKERWGCQDVYLEVRISNTPAINLYKKLGFTISYVRRGYYRDGEDAYEMSLKL
ncbi:ribosomal-protein-alanine N-acetyltransferase [Candidatus Geothermarchaeota archaeon ex4572_27]|nr:MAG: ribosomal-protein-alanine N-acetyltransferase [Candidatus Geothermarchaeota archaeon ex4572_27]